MKTTRTIRHRVGERISLEGLREFVDITKDLNGDLTMEIEAENGQRDAVYYYLVVRENIDV